MINILSFNSYNILSNYIFLFTYTSSEQDSRNYFSLLPLMFNQISAFITIGCVRKATMFVTDSYALVICVTNILNIYRNFISLLHTIAMSSDYIFYIAGQYNYLQFRYCMYNYAVHRQSIINHGVCDTMQPNLTCLLERFIIDMDTMYAHHISILTTLQF